jgi:uncharacterized protein YndB with AHSA1/START domain
MDGSYMKVDGRPAVRFERRLSHPQDAVWRAITVPGELAKWFPSAVEVDLRVGGQMAFTFPMEGVEPMDGEVLALDPPRRFWFMWGEDELRFDLEPIDGGDGTLLRFTDVLGDEGKAARDGAGWHVCLDTLDKHLAGIPTEMPGSRPSSEWRGHYERYVADGFPATAEVPSN